MANNKLEQAKKQFIKETMDEEYRSSMTGSDQYCAGMEIGLSEGYDAGHAAATAEAQSDGWVDVADRLPTENGEYDVTLQSVDRPSSEGDSK